MFIQVGWISYWNSYWASVCTSFIGRITWYSNTLTLHDDRQLKPVWLYTIVDCLSGTYIVHHNIYLGFILAAGRRLPFLMPSRPEWRLSRVWPQCMIVSQRAHCPKQILGQFKAYSMYWICCTHAFYTCDTSDILRKLRVQLKQTHLAWSGDYVRFWWMGEEKGQMS